MKTKWKVGTPDYIAAYCLHAFSAALITEICTNGDYVKACVSCIYDDGEKHTTIRKYKLTHLRQEDAGMVFTMRGIRYNTNDFMVKRG